MKISITTGFYCADTASIDVAVFCLALMGTDYPSFLREACRVLKPSGILWIAEVRSRFVNEDHEDFSPFQAGLEKLGFKLLKQDAANKMFIVFELQRNDKVVERTDILWPSLKPCLYKRR